MKDSGRRALLVINAPTSGAKPIKACTEALEAGGLTLMRRDCQNARLAELIMSVRHEIDCVVLGGSDSLLSAGAIALRDSGLPLGILPLGDRNDLALTLGIPLDPAGAAAVIVAGAARAVSLASVNGRPFFTSASVGMTVVAARALSRVASGSFGALRFGLAAFRVLMERRRFSAIIRCGAVVHRVRTIQVTIGNGRMYRAGMPPAAAGAPSEGTLCVYSLEPKRRWGLMLMSGMFAGRTDFAAGEVRTALSPVVEIVTRLPQPISVDGEVITVTPARFGVLVKAVQVYAPAVDFQPAEAVASMDDP